MKKVLLPIHDDDGEEARIKTAISIVQATGGHLTCVQALPVTAWVTGDPFGGLYPILGALEDAEAKNAMGRQRVEARLAALGIPYDWQSYNGSIGQAIVSSSRLADVIVLTRTTAKRPDPDQPPSLVADLTVSVRPPVLALPSRGHDFDPRGPALVAWNGSQEASSALRSAVPLLRLASTVQITVVAGESEEARAADAQEYLELHGIHAQFKDSEFDEGSIADALIDAATSVGAGYIVMGAYGHSRFRESVFGGVTRDMIAHCAIPLLLAH